jgi:hypothetical protein
MQILLKLQPNFFWRNLRTCETLEPVRWSRRGLHWRVILVSFLYVYNKWSVFKKSLNFFFWLSYINHITCFIRGWKFVPPPPRKGNQKLGVSENNDLQKVGDHKEVTGGLRTEKITQ